MDATNKNVISLSSVQVHNIEDPLLESMVHKEIQEIQVEQGGINGLKIEELNGGVIDFKAHLVGRRERNLNEEKSISHTKYIPQPLHHMQNRSEER